MQRAENLGNELNWTLDVFQFLEKRPFLMSFMRLQFPGYRHSILRTSLPDYRQFLQ